MEYLNHTIKKLHHTRRNRRNSATARNRFRNHLRFEQLEERRLLAAISPPDGLVSWWTADNTAEDITGRNNASLSNGASFTAGRVDNGFDFDGVNDILAASSVGLPVGSADRTIELWARIDQQVASEAFFASYGSPGLYSQVYTLGTVSDGRLFVSTWGTAISGPTLQTNRWYHVAATNVGRSFKLYLDGKQVASGEMDVNTPEGSTFWMGRESMTSIGDSRRLDGMVDEVTVYNRALSATEIQSIYSAGSSGKIKNNYITADFPVVVEGPASSVSTATFTIRRTGDLTGEAVVNWTTSDGSATTAGSDYIGDSDQIVFLEGVSQATVIVNVNGDAIAEFDETIQLVLSTTTPGYAISNGLGTILTDDVGISVANDAATEGGATIRPLGALVPAGPDNQHDFYGMTLGPDGNLYASTQFGSGVFRFDASTGNPLPAPGKPGAEFVSPGAGGLTWARDIIFGPDGYLYVVSEETDSVLRYDPTNGTPAGLSGLPGDAIFISSGAGGLDAPRGLMFQNGFLYVTSVGGTTLAPGKDSVLRFDAKTGLPQGLSGLPGDAVFIASGSGGLDNPSRIVFGPDGKAYVSSTASTTLSATSNSVLRYDTSSGAPAGVSGNPSDAVFVAPGSGGLDGPVAMVFRPDGLYVVGWRSNSVNRYQTSNGEFAGPVVPSGSGGLHVPIDLLFDTDGTLLVTSRDTNEVLRFGLDSQFAFKVSLSSASAAPVSVAFQTEDISALTGSDYAGVLAAPTATLHFAPGETNKTILIRTVDNASIELAETFRVKLSNASGGVITSEQGIGTILDNDTKFYVVDDATLNKNFEYASNGAVGESYNLSTGNAGPRGAASTASGDKVWVVDTNRIVYVYNPHGVLLGSWTAGNLTGATQLEGIATNGTDIWLVDNKLDKVYKYTGAASRLSGTHNADNAGSFLLNSSNKSPKDIVTDGNYLWVVDDSATDKVFRYRISTPTVNVGSWTIASGNPTGITLDPSNPTSPLWVVDNGASTDRVYQYGRPADASTSGSLSGTVLFVLQGANSNPQGIADPPTSGDAVVLELTAHSPANELLVSNWVLLLPIGDATIRDRLFERMFLKQEEVLTPELVEELVQHLQSKQLDSPNATNWSEVGSMVRVDETAAAEESIESQVDAAFLALCEFEKEAFAL